jgi:hypothetical protein
MAITLTPTEAVPDAPNFTIKSTWDAVIEEITTDVLVPAVVPPVFTTDAVTMGGNLKLE